MSAPMRGFLWLLSLASLVLSGCPGGRQTPAPESPPDPAPKSPPATESVLDVRDTADDDPCTQEITDPLLWLENADEMIHFPNKQAFDGDELDWTCEWSRRQVYSSLMTWILATRSRPSELRCAVQRVTHEAAMNRDLLLLATNIRLLSAAGQDMERLWSNVRRAFPSSDLDQVRPLFWEAAQKGREIIRDGLSSLAPLRILFLNTGETDPARYGEVFGAVTARATASGWVQERPDFTDCADGEFIVEFHGDKLYAACYSTAQLKSLVRHPRMPPIAILELPCHPLEPY